MSQYSDIEHTDIMLILVQSKLYHELELSRTNSKLSTELMLYHMQVRYHFAAVEPLVYRYPTPLIPPVK